jgi:CPA1 family monovalent cation:H+ antiporter
VRLLKLDGEDGLDAELDAARADMTAAALATLDGKDGPAADHWRYGFEAARAAALPGGDCAPLDAKRQLGLAAMRKQRKRLEQLRSEQKVGGDAFLILQEELDFHEVALSSEDDRHIEES